MEGVDCFSGVAFAYVSVNRVYCHACSVEKTFFLVVSSNITLFKVMSNHPHLRVCLGLVLLVFLSLTINLANCDWIMYQGDSSHSGIAYVQPVINPVVLWVQNVSAAVYSAPIVSEGIVYVGANDNLVRAITASNGEPVWNFTTGGAVISTPVIGYN